MASVPDDEKRYAEVFVTMKTQMIKHGPFLLLLGAGGGAYLWYITVHVHATRTHT